MKSDLYTVTIPSVLTQLVGKQNIREQLEDAAQTIFAEWAHPNLVEKIKVTKPRGKNKAFSESAKEAE